MFTSQAVSASVDLEGYYRSNHSPFKIYVFDTDHETPFSKFGYLCQTIPHKPALKGVATWAVFAREAG